MELCLCSVVKAIKNLDAEIIVVDNNSSDDSKTFFQDKFTMTTFIWNSKNVGFAKANNQALRTATGKYTLFLNPDTIVPADCFTKCIAFFESHPGIGALGIHMIDGSGKFLKESKRSFPSPATSLYKLAGLASLFPKSRYFARYHLGNLDEHKNNEVDVLAGAFIFTQKKILDMLKGFDEDFFMYGEDVDLSYRIQKEGYKNFYFAGSTIIHFKGESTKKGSINYVRIFYRAMSIFVRKHYGGSKAGIFNLLIQCAILARGLVSAAGRFTRWIGIPAIDAATILLSFWLTKYLWNRHIRQEVSYSSNLLIAAFSAFTIIFLLASYFSGLYDKGYKQSKLNRSAIAAIVALLAGYSLLPESLRFSRGILVFGSVMAYTCIALMRLLLVKCRVLENFDEEEQRQTIIAGTPTEFAFVESLMQSAGMEKRILGRVEVDEQKRAGTIGNVNDIAGLLKMYPIKELVLCEGFLPFKKIIDLVKILPHQIRIKFFASGTETIIGSDSKNISGSYVTRQSNLRLGKDVGKRNKHLADLIISVALLASFPIHLLFQKRPARFFSNVLKVLANKKTWVGYASSSRDLPALKPGIISVTSVPLYMNSMPEESLVLADKWYAKHYTLWHDVQLVLKSYKYLDQ